MDTKNTDIPQHFDGAKPGLSHQGCSDYLPELLKRCEQRFKAEASFDEEIEPWRIELARDLNLLMELIQWNLETDGCDWHIERVASFEEIAAGKPCRW